MDYYTYIKSEEWFNLTKPIRNRNHGLCECCLIRFGEVVHHRTYKNLGHEKDEDLIHVCHLCHNEIHKKRRRGGYFFIWESRRKFLKQLQNEIAKELKDARWTSGFTSK